MKIHEIMNPHPRFVLPEDTLKQAAQVLRELDVGAVPVCDHERAADAGKHIGGEALNEISKPSQPQR